MIEQIDSPADAGTRLAHRARHDEAFRRQMLADPMAAAEKELGRLSEAQLTVHEERANGVYLVLPLARRVPAAPARAAGQLSDAGQAPDDCPFPPPCFYCTGQGCWDAA